MREHTPSAVQFNEKSLKKLLPFAETQFQP